jgi:hypothetical protein
MCAPRVVIGRCIGAQCPLILRGRSAVSLSSGGIITLVRHAKLLSVLTCSETDRSRSSTPGPVGVALRHAPCLGAIEMAALLDVARMS